MPKATTNRQTLPQIVKAIKALEKTNISNVVEIGRLLQEASEKCEHGKYQAWLAIHFGWSYRSAVNYRNVFDFSQKCKRFTFEHFTLSAIYVVAGLDTEIPWQAAAYKAILETASHRRINHREASGTVRFHFDNQPEPAAPVEPPAIPPRPIRDDPPPAEFDDDEIEADDGDDETETPSSSDDDADADDEREQEIMLIQLKDMLEIPEGDRIWPALIADIGAAKLRKFIMMLQAVYEAHCENSAVKSAADRAEDKAARKQPAH
jgi:Protein of unknown function (DUF3102)